jgi:hypothetical protein
MSHTPVADFDAADASQYAGIFFDDDRGNFRDCEVECPCLKTYLVPTVAALPLTDVLFQDRFLCSLLCRYQRNYVPTSTATTAADDDSWSLRSRGIRRRKPPSPPSPPALRRTSLVRQHTAGISTALIERMITLYAPSSMPTRSSMPRYVFFDWDQTLSTWEGLLTGLFAKLHSGKRSSLYGARDFPRIVLESIFGGAARMDALVQLLDALVARDDVSVIIITNQSQNDHIVEVLRELRPYTNAHLDETIRVVGRRERNGISKCTYIGQVMRTRCASRAQHTPPPPPPPPPSPSNDNDNDNDNGGAATDVMGRNVKPSDVEQRRREFEPRGQCFPHSYRTMRPGDVLVHGYVPSPAALAGVPMHILHAWIVRRLRRRDANQPNNKVVVIDALGECVRETPFADFGPPDQLYSMVAYTHAEMHSLAADSGTYGPWHTTDAERRATQHSMLPTQMTAQLLQAHVPLTTQHILAKLG